jgi:glutamine amidotransferase
MGNLRSVLRAFERVGAEASVVSKPEQVERAERLVVPGVGALGDCMRALERDGLDEAIRNHLVGGRPYLGICLGLHVLLEGGDEGGAVGLGLLRGRVRRFPDALGLAVPHMGWNQVEPTRPHPVVQSGYYYFVHSYRAELADSTAVLARTEYGEPFVSAVSLTGGIAVQFHPEKSQRLGLELLDRFCRWAP